MTLIEISLKTLFGLRISLCFESCNFMIGKVALSSPKFETAE